MSAKDIGKTKDFLRTAKVLSEAVPYIRRYAGSTVVVKFGGHAMVEPELASLFAQDIVLMRQVGVHPIIVHGGGPQIDQMLKRLAIKSEFVDGLRVTTPETMQIVEMVLAGAINKEVVSQINQAGGCAIGLSGKDGALIRARKLPPVQRKGGGEADLGLVGHPAKINAAMLASFAQTGIVPVIAPIGVGENGETYNINADTVAGAVAAATRAKRMLMLTDVAGVLDGAGELIPEMSEAEAKKAIADGTITGGMIPKVQTCLDAVASGVEAAVILDGRIPHALLLEIFTAHGVGTLIRAAHAGG
ncbi:MAG TPA: acetylglutamate kinase [Alphaproteobacteria bacterium]